MDLSVVFVLSLAFLLIEGRRDFPPTPRIQYSREFLLKWSNHPDLSPLSDLPTSVLDSFVPNQGQKTFSNEPHKRVRKRGKRGGVRERMKRQSLSRIPLPSIILINAQSLRKKTDELQAHAHFSHEFRDACILAVTETWLAEKDWDSELVIDGFGAPLRTDRDAQTTGKTRRGGVCLYINDRWCKKVLVRESLCTKSWNC